MKRHIFIAFALSTACCWDGHAPQVCAQSATTARRISKADAQSFAWPTLSVNNAFSLPSVKAIQFLLRNRGYFASQPDGRFGSGTARAVRNFQRANNLKADGVVGAQTWPFLLLRLKHGDHGDAVRALQILLRTEVGPDGQLFTPDLPVDGIFGDQTSYALHLAQAEANRKQPGFHVDNLAGPQTWSALLYKGHI